MFPTVHIYKQKTTLLNFNKSTLDGGTEAWRYGIQVATEEPLITRSAFCRQQLQLWRSLFRYF